MFSTFERSTKMDTIFVVPRNFAPILYDFLKKAFNWVSVKYLYIILHGQLQGKEDGEDHWNVSSSVLHS